MKLSISNIAWDEENDETIFQFISEKGYSAIEIAPTRIIKENPYDNIEEAVAFANKINKKYNLKISSMQSIWYGKQGNIFNEDDAKMFIEYTKKAIDFAKNIKCNNLVFGCPKNRVIPDDIKDDEIVYFFKELGDYAYENSTVLSIEPNPDIYGTNFINNTTQAFDFVRKINSEGIKVNLDFGTIIQNKESLDIVSENIDLINHIHISEPFLEKVQHREEHKELARILKDKGYKNYVSIEMKKLDNISQIFKTIEYVKEIFG